MPRFFVFRLEEVVNISMISTLSEFLVAQSAPPADGVGALFNMLIPFVLIFVIFYFLVVMPQKKQQKKLQEMLGSLQKGDRVITTSGIFGRVTEVRADSFKIEIAPKVVVSVQKSAVISRVAEENDSGETTETKNS